jgi:hypothetical protein
MSVGAQAYEAIDLTDVRDYAIFDEGRQDGWDAAWHYRLSPWHQLKLVAISAIVGGAVVEILHVVR